MSVIWIPDGEPFEVEWYTSEGKATGVQRISEHFVAHPVGPPRDVGFADRADRAYSRYRGDPPKDKRG